MDIQIFKHPQFGDIRCMKDEKGEPWFVGKDVASVLGYSKPLDAIQRHVDEDDSVKHGLTDSLGRTQQTIIINESGLYSLILGSKLPQAKEFKRWRPSGTGPVDLGAHIVVQASRYVISHGSSSWRLLAYKYGTTEKITILFGTFKNYLYLCTHKYLGSL